MDVALDDYTRNALVGAGALVVLVVCMLVAAFWPGRRR